MGTLPLASVPLASVDALGLPVAGLDEMGRLCRVDVLVSMVFRRLIMDLGSRAHPIPGLFLTAAGSTVQLNRG